MECLVSSMAYCSLAYSRVLCSYQHDALCSVTLSYIATVDSVSSQNIAFASWLASNQSRLAIIIIIDIIITNMEAMVIVTPFVFGRHAGH